MANYYNICGWRHTGFNPMNRPYDRNVLNRDEFLGENMYFQSKGIYLNREDMFELTYIDVEGSVKDYDGVQHNEPNSIGAHGPGGPFYSWEEVDYVRITRTGYPGDVDFVDISTKQHDPWNAPHEGKKLFIGYYFVTALEPLARDVTRVYLSMDLWTTMGGANELEIVSGIRTRGHITDAEDSSGYYLGGEGFTPQRPMIAGGYKRLLEISDTEFTIVASSIDLQQYDPAEQDVPSMLGITAQAETGAKTVVPYIRLTEPTRFTMAYGSDRQVTMSGLGLYLEGAKTRYNMALLNSVGQLELQDVYRVPSTYISVHRVNEPDRHDFLDVVIGRETDATAAAPPVAGSYPRKADYFFAQSAIMSESTGAINSQPVANLASYSVKVWACPLPGGNPYARFLNIKNSTYVYDQSVSGSPWMNQSVTIQGAAGSFWNSMNLSFSQQDLDRKRQEAALDYDVFEKRHLLGSLDLAGRTAQNAAAAGLSGVSATNILSGGRESLSALGALQSNAVEFAGNGIDYYANQKKTELNIAALNQEQAQINSAVAKARWQMPTISFMPTLGSTAFIDNTFSTYYVDLHADDKRDFRTLLKRYGYSQLCETLTYERINIKSRVNYVEATGAAFKHHHYPMRVVMGLTELFYNGFFLWNEKPSQDAFNNNPDR